MDVNIQHMLECHMVSLTCYDLDAEVCLDHISQIEEPSHKHSGARCIEQLLLPEHCGVGVV